MFFIYPQMNANIRKEKQNNLSFCASYVPEKH